MKVNLSTTLLRASRVYRWGAYELLVPESDASHSMAMVALAMANIPKVNSMRLKRGLPLVNLKELVYRCAIHDFDECVTGDIPTKVKYSDQGFLDSLNRVAKNSLVSELGEEVAEDILNAKKYDTLEGIWCEILDYVQGGLKLCTETRLGNQIMRDILPTNFELLTYVMNRLKERSEKEYAVEIDFLKSVFKLETNLWETYERIAIHDQQITQDP